MAEYIHGTDPAEQARLTRLNEIVNPGSLAELALRGGERILDVGSGLGQLGRAMARAAAPGGRVLGIESRPEQIAEARRQAAAAGETALVEFRHGEAPALPLAPEERGSFDLVHTRFLLEHVPDPQAVVDAMVRAARPGGRIVLEDDCHDVLRLHPEVPGLAAAWAAYLRGYERLGCDPLVGHKLVALLAAAGARPLRNTWIFFGACQGEARFAPLVDNLDRVLAGAGERLRAEGLLEPGALDSSRGALAAWMTRPDAAMWFAISWAEGRRA